MPTLSQVFAKSAADSIREMDFGITPHPAFARVHGSFLRSLADRPGPRQDQLRELLQHVDSLARNSARGMSPTVARLIHRVHAIHAALGYAWVPRWAIALDDAIAQARGDYAAARPNGAFTDLTPTQAAVRAMLTLKPGFALAAYLQRRKARSDQQIIELLKLRSFDFPRAPSIVSVTPEEVRWRCPCAREAAQPLAQAALPHRCECGVEAAVPVPPLGAVLQAIRAQDEADRGIVHCAVCGARVRSDRGPAQAAGYCTKACAAEAGVRVDDAPAAPVSGPLTCRKCGGKSRAGSSVCKHCGAALAAP